MDDVDDDLTCSKGVAETLETIVKKPFSNKEIKPLSQINFDYLQKWMACLDDMREELQSLWKAHEKYLEDSIELCKFEEEYGVVGIKSMGPYMPSSNKGRFCNTIASVALDLTSIQND